jgi:predicted pyridoxine 5'-phosphate oxidase superfamily flavin-nucleotide-binding protein
MDEKKESHFGRVAELEEKKKEEEVKITEEMEDVIAKTRNWVIATATEDGIPNVVPMAYAKVLSKNQLMLVDFYLQKTKTNLLTNPNIAVSIWDPETKKGYQFKGTAQIETSGAIFDEAVVMARQKGAKSEPKSAVVIAVREIYVITPGADAGKKVSGAAVW